MQRQALAQLENTAFGGAFVLLIMALVAYAVSLVLQRDRITPRVGQMLTSLAAVCVILSLAVRGLQPADPRLPLTTFYEFSLCFVIGIVGAFAIAAIKWDLRWAGPVVIALALSGLWVARANYHPVEDHLMVALRSPWRNIHIGTAILAYGPMALAAVTGSGAMFRFLTARGRAELAGAPAEREEASPRLVPPADKLEDLTYKLISFGFVWLTALIVTGAVWAQEAWSRWWGWDPKEVWSLITWVIYLVYLHMRLVRGWRGVGPSAFAVIGFVAVLFTYMGVNWLTRVLHLESLHTYL